MATFQFSELLPLGPDTTPYRLITSEGVESVELAGRPFLVVAPESLAALTSEAMRDIQHLLRPGHLAQLRSILDDPDASPNDRFVALDLLKNANIAAGGVLPMCQDTGTVIVSGKRGTRVLTDFDDEEVISRAVFDAYQKLNLRYSQLAPLSMWEERNTGTNLPAQIEISVNSHPGSETAYHLLYMAKGGGSANKSLLFQETKAVLNPASFRTFLDEKLRSLGTAACPPYHLAVVVGGTSAEFALKTAKYASARQLDGLPVHGTEVGHGFRDLDMEAEILQMTRDFGIGAQFGGKYFCHDVRVIRLPRHGASVPVAIAVSCSADRQAKAKITTDGVFLEELEREPAHYLPDITDDHLDDNVVSIDLDRPMDEIRAELSRYPVRTRVSLHGSMVVARDIAHAKISEMLERGEPMPDYLRDKAVYYAVLSDRPPPAAWTVTSTGSRRLAARSSCWQRVIAATLSPGPVKRTAASTSDPSVVRQRVSPKTASRESRFSIFPSSAWRPCGALRCATSPRSSWLTTRAMTFSPTRSAPSRRGFRSDHLLTETSRDD